MNQTKSSYQVWMKRTTIVLSLFLVMGVIGWTAPSISRANIAQPKTGFGEPPLQATAMPVSPLSPAYSSFQTTLGELGYGERTLTSPWASTQYTFRLPDNWLTESGSYLDLEFSYFFTDPGKEGGDEPASVFLGNLLVYVDEQLLQVYSLNQLVLDHARLRVDLPPELFNERPGDSHKIRVELDAWFLCNTLHKAQLVIHPESTLHLNYTLLPLVLDLASYPRPFYQRSFAPDQVRFILPAQPSEAEMRAAAGIAAKLGELTSGMTISVTTDADWLAMIDAGRANPEHLFVIGQPSRNGLSRWLNDNEYLPVSMRRREMGLSMRGPSAVMPGDTLSYTVTVTNTLPTSATFSLINQLPRYTTLSGCHPACADGGNNEISWQMTSLLPGEATFFFLTLELTDTIQISQSLLLENTAVLSNDTEIPLNISSLTTAVGTVQEIGEQAASSSQDDYFFMQNGQPVPDGDGILQEIISPWDSGKAILVITGVSEKAIHKASQALILETSFPAMKGPVALIRRVQPSPPMTTAVTIDRTLADLGYSDSTIYGVYSQEITYWFPVPLGWRLTDDAYFHLRFNHSETIDEQGSTLTILLNDAPLANIVLDQENAIDGSLQVALPDSYTRHGTSNKLSVRVWMQANQDECERIDINQVWLNISQDSLLHLGHQAHDISVLDLDYFPFPFNTQPDLSDILFVIPPFPGPTEQESLLQLASVLGNATNGAGFSPAVSMGETLDTEMLSRYHIIAIGRPSANPILQQVNSLLPQPFVPGSDEVEHQVGKVLLRLPPDTSLGYIQEIQSPWNKERALLAVTGTTDEGVTWATNGVSRQMWKLEGDLVLVREGGEEIQSIDSRGLTSSGMASAVATAVPELTPVATVASTLEGADSDDTPPQSTPATSATGQPGQLPTWVILLVGVTILIVALIFAVAVRQFRQR